MGYVWTNTTLMSSSSFQSSMILSSYVPFFNSHDKYLIFYHSASLMIDIFLENILFQNFSKNQPVWHKKLLQKVVCLKSVENFTNQQSGFTWLRSDVMQCCPRLQEHILWLIFIQSKAANRNLLHYSKFQF